MRILLQCFSQFWPLLPIALCDTFFCGSFILRSEVDFLIGSAKKTWRYWNYLLPSVIGGSWESVTSVVSFGFLPQHFGRWWVPTNDGFAWKWTQLLVFKKNFKPFALLDGGDAKTLVARPCTEPPGETFTI